mmetsp:Transcript_21146/g.62994  ORF Transcript_21146/g.62994 Transcript_21146/m.62994 type:complete len:353 (-) Transcript_21146:943-2001(-)
MFFRCSACFFKLSSSRLRSARRASRARPRSRRSLESWPSLLPPARVSADAAADELPDRKVLARPGRPSPGRPGDATEGVLVDRGRERARPGSCVPTRPGVPDPGRRGTFDFAEPDRAREGPADAAVPPSRRPAPLPLSSRCRGTSIVTVRSGSNSGSASGARRGDATADRCRRFPELFRPGEEGIEFLRLCGAAPPDAVRCRAGCSSAIAIPAALAASTMPLSAVTVLSRSSSSSSGGGDRGSAAVTGNSVATGPGADGMRGGLSATIALIDRLMYGRPSTEATDGRCAGFGDSIAEIRDCNSAEYRSGTGGKRPRIIFRMRPGSDFPLKACLRVVISYRRHPRDHTSDLRS